MKSRILALLLALLTTTVLIAEETPNADQSQAPIESAKKYTGERLKLTLDDAKRIALEQNPTLAQAQASIDAALAAVISAQSAYYPSIDISGGISRLRDQATTRPVRDWNNTTAYEIGLSVSWLFFDGGARGIRELSAKLGSEIAVEDCEDAKRLLMEQVAYAFYNVLQQQNTMDISQQDAEFNRQLKEDAQTKWSCGTMKRSDVLNFEYQVQTAEVNYISAKLSWRNSCVILGELLSIRQDDIWDALELVAPAEEEVKVNCPPLQELIDYAWENRPDLKATRQQVMTAQLALEEAKTRWYPTISGFLNYGFERTHAAHFNKHYDRDITYGVAASWNLFDGFQTTAAIQEAEANLAVATKRLEAVEDQLDAEIRNAYTTLEMALKVLEREDELLKVATEIRRLVQEEYQNGTATITRVNEVQTDLVNTELGRSTAWISVLKAEESLNAVAARNNM